MVQRLLHIANSPAFSSHSHQAALIALHKVATKAERQAISDAITKKNAQAETPVEGGGAKPAEHDTSSPLQKQFMMLLSK